jgi:hypothetical protein
MNQLTRTIAETDPVTGEQVFSLFTEDGHGNGNLIFSVPLAKIRALIEAETGEECTTLPPLALYKPGTLVEVRTGPLHTNPHFAGFVDMSVPPELVEWREAHIVEFAPEFNAPFYVVAFLDGTRPAKSVSGSLIRPALYDEA